MGHSQYIVIAVTKLASDKCMIEVTQTFAIVNYFVFTKTKAS
jgi:ribosomal silencing factor RsfS